MGTARFSSDAWRSYSATTATKSDSDIFTTKGGVPSDLDPINFKLRESRDSEANPQSNALIIASDVTGSMGIIASNLVREGIGIVFGEILRRSADPDGRMITDPHLMVLGIGDVACDQGPIQATQFEADLTIATQLERMWIEGGGGGNDHESYDLAYYMAALRTSIDCFEKRGKKGYLFTVGDECTPEGINRLATTRFFGDNLETDLSVEQLLAMAERTYNVFHVIIEEGNFASTRMPLVKERWTKLLGQRVLPLSDYRKLAEVIVSAIQVNEGLDRDTVAASWGGDTSIVVAKATSELVASGAGDTDVMRL